LISSSYLEEVFIPENKNEKRTKAGKKFVLFLLDKHDYRMPAVYII
jgi:hypothetical protein